MNITFNTAIVIAITAGLLAILLTFTNKYLLNFKKEGDNTVMIYSFTGLSIASGKTKLLTKLEDDSVVLNEDKSAAGTPEGLQLAVKFKSGIQYNHIESFILGPNPSNGFMNLFFNLPEARDILLLKVYNLNGTMVWSGDEINIVGQQKTPINLESLNDGVYFIVVEAYKDGELKEKKVEKIIMRK